MEGLIRPFSCSVESAFPMNRFSNDRGALDFITSRIAEEAQREGVALSDVERKMLYFSETAWTLPDIWDVSDKFDRDYDQDLYERKLSGLIKNAVNRARSSHDPEEYKAWADAVRHLSKEDRYLLVMVHQAKLGSTFRRSSSSKVVRRIQATMILGLASLYGLAWMINRRFPETNLPADARGRYGFAMWLAMMCFAVLAEIVLQLARFSGKVSRALDWLIGVRGRPKQASFR
jgi:uncharacterized protein YlbG (UPF0298 family)